MPSFDPTSRYRTTDILVDDTEASIDQTLLYASREPLQFQDHPENTVHTVEAGDTLWRLAARHFAGFSEPSNMWWAIAEYQPTPIGDPTLQIKPGTLLILPPPSLVGAFLGTRPEAVV